MPTFVKFITIFASDAGQGWQEVHYRSVDSGEPNLLSQLEYYRTNIAPLRATLLGEDCSIVGYRASFPRANDVASFGLREKKPGVSGRTGAAAQLSLAIQWKETSFTKSKITHLRGFWDTLEHNETYQPQLPVNADWEPNLTAWKQALITGQFGWPTKDPATSAKGQVVGYAEDVGGQVTLTLAKVTGALPAADEIIPVQVSRVNDSNSPLNRELQYTVLTPTTIKTVRQVAVGPFKSKGRFIYRATVFTRYNQTGSISVGRRRMGKPLNRAPGRSAVKPLY